MEKDQEPKYSPENSFDPQLAEEYLLLQRGSPHSLRWVNPLSPEERLRGEALLDEIVAQTPELSRESLSRMLFANPDDKLGRFDFAMIAMNWERPPKGFVDQWKPYRKLMKEHCLVGPLERRFLLVGDEQIEEHNPSPSYFYYAKPSEATAA